MYLGILLGTSGFVLQPQNPQPAGARPAKLELHRALRLVVGDATLGDILGFWPPLRSDASKAVAEGVFFSLIWRRIDFVEAVKAKERQLDGVDSFDQNTAG